MNADDTPAAVTGVESARGRRSGSAAAAEAATVSLTRNGHVGVVTLVNPTRRNALTRSMIARLHAVCDEIDADPEIGATVLRGANGTFCSGVDRSDLDSTVDPLDDAEYRIGDDIYGVFQRFGRVGTPTVVAVRGAAVGAGVNLMLAGDLRVVAVDARIRAGFLPVGLHPGGGFFSLCGRSGGREAAAGFGLFGCELDGVRAVSLGLAWESLDDADVEERAEELAAGVAADPELARRAVGSMRAELGPPVLPWAVAAEYERATQLWSLRRRERAAPRA